MLTTGCWVSLRALYAACRSPSPTGNSAWSLAHPVTCPAQVQQQGAQPWKVKTQLLTPPAVPNTPQATQQKVQQYVHTQHLLLQVAMTRHHHVGPNTLKYGGAKTPKHQRHQTLNPSQALVLEPQWSPLVPQLRSGGRLSCFLVYQTRPATSLRGSMELFNKHLTHKQSQWRQQQQLLRKYRLTHQVALLLAALVINSRFCIRTVNMISVHMTALLV